MQGVRTVYVDLRTSDGALSVRLPRALNGKDSAMSSSFNFLHLAEPSNARMRTQKPNLVSRTFNLRLPSLEPVEIQKVSPYPPMQHGFRSQATRVPAFWCGVQGDRDLHEEHETLLAWYPNHRGPFVGRRVSCGFIIRRRHLSHMVTCTSRLSCTILCHFSELWPIRSSFQNTCPPTLQLQYLSLLRTWLLPDVAAADSSLESWVHCSFLGVLVGQTFPAAAHTQSAATLVRARLAPSGICHRKVKNPTSGILSARARKSA